MLNAMRMCSLRVIPHAVALVLVFLLHSGNDRGVCERVKGPEYQGEEVGD